jgi:hypothetical protein
LGNLHKKNHLSSYYSGDFLVCLEPIKQFLGGAGGIRTLDAGFAHILP